MARGLDRDEELDVLGDMELVSNLPTFSDIIEEDLGFEVTRYVRKLGYVFNYRAAVMPGLLRELLPPSEDQVKGRTFMDNIDNLASEFRRATKGSESPDMVFTISVPTYVKCESADGLEVRTKARVGDKRVRVHVSMIPESMVKLKTPALLFGKAQKKVL